MEWATIRAPARLHLGFIPSRDKYGSAAIAIEHPSLILRMRKSEKIDVIGPYSHEFFMLASSFLDRFSDGNGIEILVENAIGRHIGLGSGTRMALAVGMGIDAIYNLGLSPYDIAEFFGRGRNSKAGLETLIYGGFALSYADGTLKNTRLPENWLFIVALPNIQHRFFGEKEKSAMHSITIPHIHGNIGKGMEKAILSKDIRKFGRLLTYLDNITGEIFKEAQNGNHTSKMIGRVKEFGLEKGAYGAGQSSWGPAVYFLIEKGDSEILDDIQAFLDRNGGGYAFITGAASEGMKISIVAKEDEMMHETTQSHRILYKSG